MPIANALSIPRSLRLFPPKTIKASCLITDIVGKCVYISGDSTDSVFQVSTSDPLNGEVTMPSIGVIISKRSDTECVVQIAGAVEDILSGLTPGGPMFVGTAGVLSHALPVPTALAKASVQQMGVALDQVTLVLSPSLAVTRRVL